MTRTALSIMKDIRRGERLIIVPFVRAFGGVERLVITLANYLAEHGQAHRVVCFDDTIGLHEQAAGRLRVDVIRGPRTSVLEACRLGAYMAAARAAGAATPLVFDLKGAFYAHLARLSEFVLHLTDPPSLLPADASRIRFDAPLPGCKPIRAPLLLRVRGQLVHEINRRGARRASSVVVMTDAIAAELRRLYHIESRIVRPGVVLPSATLEVPRGQRQARILSVSRLEPSKNIDWILRALAQESCASCWTFDVVGDGSYRSELEALAHSLGLGARVTFHGRLSDEARDRLFATASVFVMPAVQGYGLPALEALTRGVPVVLNAGSGVAEILGGSQWTQVSEDDPDLFADALNSMLESLLRMEYVTKPRPHIPSATDWATQLCSICGWAA